jgi:transcriptional regulator with XRE-family HTH domain
MMSLRAARSGGTTAAERSKSAVKPKRPQPNVSDPLSETSPQRRLWAAYLRRGFTRADFARALGVTYNTLDAWDTEARTPDLLKFDEAARLVGFTVDELLHGHGAARSGGAALALSDAAIRTALDQRRATPNECRALGEFRASPRGMFARITESYLTAFLRGYAHAAGAGVSHEEARARAVTEAERLLAVEDAQRAGVQAVAPGTSAVRALASHSKAGEAEIRPGLRKQGPSAKTLRQRDH